jgi:hypothetical protein
MGYAQRGLPGVLLEADPLPSEVVLDGGALSARRREALRGLREMLIDRHPDVDPEDWRVFAATVAPPYAHLPRAPGTAAKSLGVMQAAKDCFPHLSPSAALKSFRDAQQRPAVRALVADFRSLELADLHEQRGLVREALHASITRGAAALYGLDPSSAPNEWARVSACVTAACKVLADMDALAVRPEETALLVGGGGSDDPDDNGTAPATLLARVSAVAEDIKRRKVAAGGAA